jgi:hypothetical protein
MAEDAKIDVDRDEYGAPGGGYGYWAQIEEDRKTHQIVSIWMGDATGPGRHYANLPVYVKPNMEILLCWGPDRLVIREPLLQNDFPNTYRRKTLILKPTEQGGMN